VPTSFTPEYLLQGAAYALEQCGLLLRDANSLYSCGSYASAVALAAFAQEELGRWEILRKLRKQVLAGGIITNKHIQDACKDHVDKQRAGALSTVMRADNDTQLGKLMRTYMNAKPGSKEWKAAREHLEQARRQKAKRDPSNRHKQRETALYVDPVSGGWKRPTEEITQAFAFDDLQDAANDYSGQYDRYTNPETYKPDDPGFYSALEQWADRPTLPRPEGPLLPPSALDPSQVPKQLNRWRGLWRVWLIGTVAWAVWTFWESDQGCLIHLVSRPAEMPPWCDYRDFDYYAWLLVSMFGVPALIAIFLLASRWAIAGFSEPRKPN
jgi:AbiV family abortive infection protein